MTLTPKLEAALTGAITVGCIIGVGALKTQGIIDAETSILATGFITGGGMGWAGRTLTAEAQANRAAPPP